MPRAIRTALSETGRQRSGCRLPAFSAIIARIAPPCFDHRPPPRCRRFQRGLQASGAAPRRGSSNIRKAGESAMQTECPHRRFCRLDAVRDELSPQSAERFDSLALFNQLRLEGKTESTALKAIGCSRATPCRWKRHLREQGVRGRVRDRLPAARHRTVRAAAQKPQA